MSKTNEVPPVSVVNSSNADLTLTNTVLAASTSVVNTTEPVASSSTVDQAENDRSVELTELQNLMQEVLDNKESLQPTAPVFTSMVKAMVFLRGKLTGHNERLIVKQKYALEEAFAFYKSTDFQPTGKLSVQYKGQAAVDTGGVLRQFFSDVFHQLVEGTQDLQPLFEGPGRRKYPVYNMRTVLSGVFELLGKLMAHCLAQIGIRINCLAPAAYRFLITEELTETIGCLTLDDAVNPLIHQYAEGILDANIANEELGCIFEEQGFQQLFIESGQNQFLSMSTRDTIIQGLVFHDVIGKRVAAFDQLRKGLKLLEVFEVMRENSSLFEPLFVYRDDQLTSALLIEKLRFQDVSEESQVPYQYLRQYLQYATRTTLERFLVFCTGCKILPMQPIRVVFSKHSDGIFASTCSLQLTLPSGFSSFGHFSTCFNSMIAECQKAFTSV
eukprot:gene2230-2539_t